MAEKDGGVLVHIKAGHFSFRGCNSSVLVFDDFLNGGQLMKDPTLEGFLVQ